MKTLKIIPLIFLGLIINSLSVISQTSSVLLSISACETNPIFTEVDRRLPDSSVKLFSIQVNNQWGLINEDGKLVVSPKWEEIDGFFEGRAAFKDKNGKFGFLDETGRVAIPATFEAVDRFNENRAGIKLNGKWGYIDRQGNLVIQPQYLNASPFYEARALVSLGNSGSKFHMLHGFIDNQGKLIGPIKFQEGSKFQEGFALVSYRENQAEKIGVLDLSGNLKSLENVSINKLHQFRYGLAPAVYRGLPNLAETVISRLFDPFNEFQLPDKVGFINPQGNFAIQPQFEAVSEFNYCIAAAKKQGKWGLINTKGNFLLPPQFEYQPTYLGYNVVKVQAERKTIHVDLEPIVDGVPHKYQGTHIASRYGLMNLEGEWISPPDKDYISDTFREGLLLFVQKGKSGFLNPSGQIVIEAKFEQATSFYNGRSKVRFNGKEHYIDRTGKVVW